jgi:hypothetical protein
VLRADNHFTWFIKFGDAAFFGSFGLLSRCFSAADPAQFEGIWFFAIGAGQYPSGEGTMDAEGLALEERTAAVGERFQGRGGIPNESSGARWRGPAGWSNRATPRPDALKTGTIDQLREPGFGRGPINTLLPLSKINKDEYAAWVHRAAISGKEG